MQENNIAKQAQELSRGLWDIACTLRGNMDASDFKNYILGIIFYRYLSERTELYTEEELLKDDNLTYAEAYADARYSSIVKSWSIEKLGYIIKPEYLFSSMLQNIDRNMFSIEDLEKAISELEGSTLGQPSEAAFYKLFADMNLKSEKLGREVSQRTSLISKVMQTVSQIDFRLHEAQFDVLGTAYMILIGNFASDAGKKGGEFFTPSQCSKLVASLACVGLDEVHSCCDPCAGSGSLLLDVKNHLAKRRVGHFWAQESNPTTYNLLRMNMLMHGVDYRYFTVFNDDTMKHDNFKDKKFQVQVSNPPYSVNLTIDERYLDDPRFSGAGVLPPKAKADYAFLEHIVYHMDSDGRAAVLLPHGVLFRGASEKKIREYLVRDLNVLDAVIGLPANLFHGTSIPVCCLVLKKNRNGNSGNILFIDASKDFERGKNMNILRDEHIDRIVNAYKDRIDIEKFAHVANFDELKENDYNLNIPRYVDTFEEEEEIDIHAVMAEIKELEAKRADLDKQIEVYLKELGL